MDMLLKKILILGVGNAQVDALKYLSENTDFEIHACSYINEGAGIVYSDKFSMININDTKKISEYVKENDIDIIYSIGSDIAMPTIAQVSNELSLPCFLSPELPSICNNKHFLRASLGVDFDGNLKFCVAEKLEQLAEWSIFPCILKPVDSQGQRGVYKINGKQDFEQQFEISQSYSRSNKVIVEEFVNGPEISVNLYMYRGQIKFFLVSDRIVFEDLPGGIIKEHHLPSAFTDDDDRVKIYNLVERCVKKLGISDGPVYFQIKLENGYKVIEVASRLDGCHMWDLILHFCGDNLLKATFEHLINGKEPFFNNELYDKRFELNFFCEKPGVKFNREKYDLTNACKTVWYYSTGEIVPSVNGIMEKCGYMIREVDK